VGRVEQTESPCVINSPSPRHHVFPRRQIDFNQVTIRRCQPNGLGNQLELMSQVNDRRCQMALPMTFPIPFSPHSLIVSQSIWLRQGFPKALHCHPLAYSSCTGMTKSSRKYSSPPTSMQASSGSCYQPTLCGTASGSLYRFASFGGFLVQLSLWDTTEDGTEQLLELEAGLLS